LVLIQSNGVDRAATNSQRSILIKFVGSARPPLYRFSKDT